MLTPERYAVALTADAAAFADLLAPADFTAAVPTCPEWTVADLVHHIGRAFYWAAQIVGTRTTEMIPFADVVDGALPDTGRAEWVRAGAARLVAAVADAGPATTVWTWADDKRAVFWLRRMLHESVVHRADAAIAVGGPHDVPLDVAVDGVSEWLELLARYSDRLSQGLDGTGQTLHFHGTDEGEWLVRRTPDGPVLSNEHVKADVAVRAPAADLLLALTGRKPLTEVEVFGDRELLAHWREHSKF